MKPIFPFVLILMLVLVGAQSIAAQDTPPPKIDLALNSLSTEVGQTVTLGDLDAYEWSEQTYGDSSLGCPEPGVAYAQVVTPAYQFLLTYNGKTYDYRFAQVGDFGKLCGVTDAALTPEPASGGQEVSYENVSFTVDPALAVSEVVPSTVPATDPTEDSPYFGLLPQYIHFDFVGFMGETEVNFPAQVNVYPVSDYENLGIAQIKPEIDTLRTLLSDRPDLNLLENLPYLPLVNAAPVLGAQVQYIDFNGGSGVRYVTEFSQAVMPITNEGLLYTFQGLTDDGQYYVSASFLISTTALPDSVDPGSVGSDFDVEANRVEVTQTLNALTPDDFVPNLSLLDDLINSLTIITKARS